jgi:phosphatidylglycerol---prolipoprotein diacylglyceryl transferase
MTYERYEAIIHAGNHTAYSLAVLLGMLAGGWLIRRDSLAWPLSPRRRYLVLGVASLGALLGCAIPAYFAGGVIEEVTDFSVISPKTILGGMLLSFFLVAAYKKAFRVDYDTSDAFARGGCLMMAIGRIGCVFQHCCFGKEAPPGWGVDMGDGVPRYPTQLLEAAGLFALFFFLNHLHRKGLFPHRRLFILFTAYGVLRFNMEFLREPVGAVYGPIGFYQLLALVLFLTGAFQLAKRSRPSYLGAVL